MHQGLCRMPWAWWLAAQSPAEPWQCKDTFHVTPVVTTDGRVGSNYSCQENLFCKGGHDGVFQLTSWCCSFAEWLFLNKQWCKMYEDYKEYKYASIISKIYYKLTVHLNTQIPYWNLFLCTELEKMLTDSFASFHHTRVTKKRARVKTSLCAWRLCGS